ncbi:MAG: ATP-binding protein [Gemmatimonadaceae bacterium]|nr:ATP-binding protein [Gemmatimonadaceae bacterium]
MTGAAPRGGLSIRARLALWYAASVLLVFVVFALTLRATVRTALRNEFTSGVRSSSDAIQSFFRLEYGEYRNLDFTITHLANEVVFPDRIVEFVRPDGSIAFRVGPEPRLARNSRPAGDPGSGLIAPVQQVRTLLDERLAPGWELRVFASAAPLERSLALIDQWLMIGIPIGFLFAGTMGWMLAGRTLRPVGAMAEAATRMASERRAGASAALAVNAQRLPIDNPSDELGRLGTRFNALLDQVDGVLAQQRRFLADAAHELRTPVARMLGNVDLALLDPRDAAAQSDALTRVRVDLDRTTRLIDELMQLARADAAGEVHPRPGYIDDVVVDSVHAWQPIADRKGVNLIIRTLEEAPASIDPVYIDRMIGILLDNAIRYTPVDGDIEVSVTRSGGIATLSVADTGIGIAADERVRVFERFYRGTGARALSPEGSGLGLPIARWIAQAHNATLELTDRGGVGTVATVSFPSATLVPMRTAEAHVM